MIFHRCRRKKVAGGTGAVLAVMPPKLARGVPAARHGACLGPRGPTLLTLRHGGVVLPGWHAGHEVAGLSFGLRARQARLLSHLPAHHLLEAFLERLKLAVRGRA